MVENNPLPPQTNENLERIILISTYKQGVERAILNVKSTSFIIAIPCLLASYNCMCYFSDRGWRFLCVLALAFSGHVCYDISTMILIEQVRKQWHYPQKSSSAEWERNAAKQFDDAAASCILFRWPHIIIKTMVIALVVVSVLSGAFIYVADQDHPERIYLVIGAFVLLGWYYRNDD